MNKGILFPVVTAFFASLSFLMTPLSADTDFDKAPSIELKTIAAVDKPYRLLTGKDPSGLSIEMDDGTIWTVVGSSSAATAKKWRMNDPLVIYPVFLPSVKGARFYLYNERLHTHAYAELSYGPMIGTATNLQIVYLNYNTGQLQLQDGKGRVYNYIIDKRHKDIFRNWQINESVLVGSNETWRANWITNFPFILINVEKNAYISAFFRSN